MSTSIKVGYSSKNYSEGVGGSTLSVKLLGHDVQQTVENLTSTNMKFKKGECKKTNYRNTRRTSQRHVREDFGISADSNL